MDGEQRYGRSKFQTNGAATEKLHQPGGVAMVT